MPSPYEAILLGVAAWRIWHLLADDLILDRPRRYITKRWKPTEDFIECPFCLGFWVALGWTAAFVVFPTETLWATVPFVLNAMVVAVNHWLTSD